MRVAVTERLREAAADWGEKRLEDETSALETKVEQALLEVEHLASDATEVAFEIEDDEIVYEPSPELGRLLQEEAAEAGIDPTTVLRLYLDLCARVYLDEGEQRPSNAPPTDLR